MKVSSLTGDKVKDFVAYCVKYCPEQDESYVPRHDYSPGKTDITCILLNDDNEIIGAASLMVYDENRTARFRIFHCKSRDTENYKIVLDHVLNNLKNIDYVYCFITERKKEVIDIWESLGFKIRRYSFVLERQIEDQIEFSMPEKFYIKKMTDGKDEQLYCDIINSAFAGIEGHKHFTNTNIAEMKKDPGYYDGAFNLLWENDKPVGLIKFLMDSEDGEDIFFIDTIAVHSIYQGKGLGKVLLKYGINTGREKGYKKVMLTVNAENNNATKLYFREGFNKKEVYICYNKILE